MQSWLWNKSYAFKWRTHAARAAIPRCWVVQPTNAKMSQIQAITKKFRTKMLTDLGDITEMLTRIRTEMTAMKDVLGTAFNAKVATDNMKQTRITYIEGIFTKWFLIFKTFLLSWRFSVYSVLVGVCINSDAETIEDSISVLEDFDGPDNVLYKRREFRLLHMCWKPDRAITRKFNTHYLRQSAIWCG